METQADLQNTTEVGNFLEWDRLIIRANLVAKVRVSTCRGV